MTIFDAISDGASDASVVAAIAYGDREAVTVLVRRYQRRVFGLALTMLGDRSSAEEVAQEALVRVWKHAAIYDPVRGSVSTWILSITRNLAIDRMRVRSPLPVDPEAFVDAIFISDERSPEKTAVDGDSVGRVLLALRELPVEQRRALVLASYFGRSAKEIAEAESIPIGTAKTRVRVALGKVREHLIREVDRG